MMKYAAIHSTMNIWADNAVRSERRPVAMFSATDRTPIKAQSKTPKILLAKVSAVETGAGAIWNAISSKIA